MEMDGRVTGRRAYGFVAVDVEGDDLLVAGHYRDLHLAAAVRDRGSGGAAGEAGWEDLESISFGIIAWPLQGCLLGIRYPSYSLLGTEELQKDYFPSKTHQQPNNSGLFLRDRQISHGSIYLSTRL